MEWLALVTWIIVVALALVIGRDSAKETPALGLQALAAVGGLALSIVFLAGTRADALAWVAAGLGVLGTVSLAYCAVWLSSGDRRVGRAGQSAEEKDALLVGVELLPFALAALFAALTALGVATVG